MDEHRETADAIGEGAERVVRHARAIGHEVSGIAETLAGMARAVSDRIDLPRRLRDEPAKTLLIAAGAGYVAGGGFFTPFTARLLRLGGRLWLIPTLKRQLMNEEEEYQE